MQTHPERESADGTASEQAWASLPPLMEYLALRDEPAPADVLVGLGSDSAEVGERAAAVYAAGLVPRILFVGGRGRLTGALSGTEAAFLKDVAVSCGVPASAILLEEQSTNSLENIRFGWDRLRAEGVGTGRILLVTQPVLQRRGWATARRWWHGAHILSCPPDWRATYGQLDSARRIELARLAVGEIDRLPRYGAKGDLEPQDIPAQILRCCEELRTVLEGEQTARPSSPG